jgi:Zn-dependent protease
MFNRGIRLPFTLLGIPVFADWSLLIVLAWLTWAIGGRIDDMHKLLHLHTQASLLPHGLTSYLLGFVAALGLFVSVLLHELGHAATAQAYGVKVQSIVLWFLGGVARFEEMPRQRGAEAVVAIVGPIVSLVIAGVCYAAFALVPDQLARTQFVMSYLAYANVVLAVFNLIPAIPMDGGRVLRSLLAMAMGHDRATEIAGVISKVLAVVLGLIGLLGGNFFLLVIAIFIFMAVTSETGSMRVEHALRNVPVSRLMNRNVIAVPPEATIGQLADLVWRERHTSFPVLTQDRKPLGVVRIQNAQGVDPAAPVTTIMHPLPAVSDRADASQAFHAMANNGLSGVGVLNVSGQLCGIVTKTDFVRAIQAVAGRTPGFGSAGRPVSS